MTTQIKIGDVYNLPHAKTHVEIVRAIVGEFIKVYWASSLSEETRSWHVSVVQDYLSETGKGGHWRKAR
jgi:hypothetical protein